MIETITRNLEFFGYTFKVNHLPDPGPFCIYHCNDKAIAFGTIHFNRADGFKNLGSLTSTILIYSEQQISATAAKKEVQFSDQVVQLHSMLILAIDMKICII
uniref:Uncharacterized protein n=1 Tax=Tetranychus urticae TaxID=32264 RepID=T1K614_TETUR